MDADAELDTALWRKARVALHHPVLNLDGAAHGVDDASELYENAIARPLNHAPVMHGDGGIDQIASESPQPCQRTFLVAAREAAEADHVGGQDGSKLSLF